MKRLIWFILLLMVLVFSNDSFAQNRGALTNVWASWVSVTTTPTVMTFPYNSRDLVISNGSTNTVCVDLRGNSITQNCYYGGANTAIEIAAGDQISLYDFVTGAITLRAEGATASPVSVIVTY